MNEVHVHKGHEWTEEEVRRAIAEGWRLTSTLSQGRKEAYLDAAKKCRENGAVKVPFETVEQFANKLADHFEGLAELWGEK